MSFFSFVDIPYGPSSASYNRSEPERLEQSLAYLHGQQRGKRANVISAARDWYLIVTQYDAIFWALQQEQSVKAFSAKQEALKYTVGFSYRDRTAKRPRRHPYTR